jgi:hypothetical protein
MKQSKFQLGLPKPKYKFFLRWSNLLPGPEYSKGSEQYCGLLGPDPFSHQGKIFRKTLIPILFRGFFMTFYLRKIMQMDLQKVKSRTK